MAGSFMIAFLPGPKNANSIVRTALVAAPSPIPMRRTMAEAEDRETFRRYHMALAEQVYETDVTIVGRRFRANHRIEEGDRRIPTLKRIADAHKLRCQGESSPDAADKSARAAIADYFNERATP
jgi:hypothetical protein